MDDAFWNELLVWPWNLIEPCTSKRENYYILKPMGSKSKLLTHVWNHTHEIRMYSPHGLSGACLAATIVTKVLASNNQRLSALRFVNGFVLNSGGAKHICILRVQKSGDTVPPQYLRKKDFFWPEGSERIQYHIWQCQSICETSSSDLIHWQQAL